MKILPFLQGSINFSLYSAFLNNTVGGSSGLEALQNLQYIYLI